MGSYRYSLIFLNVFMQHTLSIIVFRLFPEKVIDITYLYYMFRKILLDVEKLESVSTVKLINM